MGTRDSLHHSLSSSPETFQNHHPFCHSSLDKNHSSGHTGNLRKSQDEIPEDTEHLAKGWVCVCILQAKATFTVYPEQPLFLCQRVGSHLPAWGLCFLSKTSGARDSPPTTAGLPISCLKPTQSSSSLSFWSPRDLLNLSSAFGSTAYLLFVPNRAPHSTAEIY